MKIYDIIYGMKAGILYILSACVALKSGAAMANWQYSGEYTYDMSYYDNGGRTAVSLRGGASYAMSGMENGANSIVYAFCVDSDGFFVYPGTDGECPSGYTYAGTGNLSSLGMADLGGLSFSAGVSLGWIIPNHPQWRLEIGWDSFSDVDYNETPLFSGPMSLSEGYTISNLPVGGVQSTMASDIISAMAFYDFFDGLYKPLHQVIPYIGIGVGYGDSKTVMSLFDPTGDLSQFEDLTNFGQLENNVVHFYRSTTNTTNIVGVGALGVSYGINDKFFVDFGARVFYLPRVKYQLVNSDDTRRLDWFSAKNLFYANVMLGIRFEF